MQQRKSAIIGMGRTGCAAARFLIERGERCEAFDEHPVTLPEDLMLPLHVGPLQAEQLKTFSRLIVSPGINWQHPALAAVRAAGTPVCGDLELFAEGYGGKVIAVTGTNGKTTTVSLISTMLDTLPGGIEAGGNIGVPMLDLLDGEVSPQRVVLELSSFQLERAALIHADWAVLLNLQPDHADMHADMEAYEAAKRRLFDAQREGDTAMLPADAHWHELAAALCNRGVRVRRFGMVEDEKGNHDTVLDAGVQLLDDGQWQLFWQQEGSRHAVESEALLACGLHQHLNLAVAAQAAADHGVSAGVIRQSLTSFRGLPHRLQILGVVAGREWYNDSKATNPEAARAALASFHQVIWICGGLRKGVDLSPLRDVVADHVAQAIVIGNDAAPFTQLATDAGVPCQFAKTMEQAVKLATHAMEGVPVLLSPAAASQDQFRDYIERGNHFSAAVAALESEA